MAGIKRKKLVTTLFFVLIGAGYFSTFSQFDLIAPLKSYVAIVPLQIGALIYCLFYLRWNSRLPRSDDMQQQERNLG